MLNSINVETNKWTKVDAITAETGDIININKRWFGNPIFEVKNKKKVKIIAILEAPSQVTQFESGMFTYGLTKDGKVLRYNSGLQIWE